jgi:hypothetical protein
MGGKKYLPVKEIMAVTTRIFTKHTANLLQQAEKLGTKFHLIWSSSMSIARSNYCTPSNEV